MKSEEKEKAAAAAGAAGAAGAVRIAVLGKVDVGKSDLLYRQTVTVNNHPLEVEIVDVSGESRDRGLPLEAAQWADACLIVYAITDRPSFEYALLALRHFRRLRSAPATLLGNKADLEHLRQVSEEEGRAAATEAGCSFFEVSVAENSPELYTAFESLMSECQRANTPPPQPHKTRKFSVTKMLGTLIGSSPDKGSHHNNHNGGRCGGTVVECRKADLHRSRVLQRRQNFSATASL